MHPLIIGGLISWLINLAIGLFIFFNNPKGEVNRKFAFFNICIGSWSLGSFLLNTIPEKNIALWVLRLSYLFGILLLPAFLSFVYVLIQEPANKIIWISRLFSIFLIFALPTRWFIAGIYILPKDGFLISSPGPVYYIFVVGFAITAWVGFSKLISAIRSSSSVKRNQLKYISAGYFIATIAGLDYFLSVFKIFKGFPIDDYILVFSFLVLAYTIIKHRLMDIKLARQYLAMNLFYGAVTSAIFMVSAFFLRQWFWGIAVVIFLAILLGPYFHRRMTRFLEPAFLGGEIPHLAGPR